MKKKPLNKICFQKAKKNGRQTRVGTSDRTKI